MGETSDADTIPGAHVHRLAVSVLGSKIYYANAYNEQPFKQHLISTRTQFLLCRSPNLPHRDA